MKKTVYLILIAFTSLSSVAFSQEQKTATTTNKSTQKVTFQIKNDTKDTHDLNFAGGEYKYIGSSSDPYEITATEGKVYMYSKLLFTLDASMQGKTLLMSELIAVRDSKAPEFK
ncbi:hypothetical protein [Fluviicola taffensis]|uniref:Uncharacterized protein n=1 Tax=Fluviicola taffensis (strain DSM 16823 / NCIMB 13979 / RW262) TaxID=755732 RepID=F2I943_FLUTR|nr:hypothetical protein [Fluviicola taffensis]AEA42990.1 hypothetical protein Fluta_0989 [Fluviicola taffensis DSM 16823]